jgi:cell division protein FtsW (lipid II flippase)|tara:strand:+ start:860 stop:2014 length:1155 start_codon:yes stop_codon:yes gene_type:complete
VVVKHGRIAVRLVEGLKRVPWSVVAAASGLVALGLAGISRGDQLAGSGALFTRQLIWVALAIPALIAAAWVPYRSLRPASYVLFGATLVLLLLVFLMPAHRGAHRWIPLGFFDMQPSELTKLTFILALSHYLMYRRNFRRFLGLFTPFLLTLVPLVLVLKEPDLGTALLFLPMLFAMLLAAGARVRHLALIGLMGVAVTPVLWLGMNAEQKSRVVSLLTQVEDGPVPRGDGYHLYQSKRMLSLGGTWGSELAGMPVDDPAAYHLPAARTDFVFCLIGERFGLIGSLLTLSIYVVLIVKGLSIAHATREPFGRLLATGIVTLLATQAIINTGMTVGLMPITGMTLPLVSYGGSSLVATAIALGLLINVAIRPGYEVTAEPFRFAT